MRRYVRISKEYIQMKTHRRCSSIIFYSIIQNNSLLMFLVDINIWILISNKNLNKKAWINIDKILTMVSLRKNTIKLSKVCKMAEIQIWARRDLPTISNFCCRIMVNIVIRVHKSQFQILIIHMPATTSIKIYSKNKINFWTCNKLTIVSIQISCNRDMKSIRGWWRNPMLCNLHNIIIRWQLLHNVSEANTY